MEGLVIKSTGSWYMVLCGNEVLQCRIKGKFRAEGGKATNPIAVGDHVVMEFEENQATAVIKEIKPRKNYMIRKATNLSRQSHVLASNIDQAIVVATLAMPRTSLGFIDRFLLTADAYNIPGVILFNKLDLYTEDGLKQIDELIDLYESQLGYRCLKTSATNRTGFDELEKLLKGKVSLLSGHSGVGKSSLIGNLVPTLDLKIAPLSEAHEKGTHTTTFAEMHPLSFGGFIIDTPGIKEFGIIETAKQELGHYFPEIRSRMQLCKFNSCLHVNEPNCAIINAVEKGEIAISRYNSYLTIMSGNELEKKYKD